MPRTRTAGPLRSPSVLQRLVGGRASDAPSGWLRDARVRLAWDAGLGRSGCGFWAYRHASPFLARAPAWPQALVSCWHDAAPAFLFALLLGNQEPWGWALGGGPSRVVGGIVWHGGTPPPRSLVRRISMRSTVGQRRSPSPLLAAAMGGPAYPRVFPCRDESSSPAHGRLERSAQDGPQGWPWGHARLVLRPVPNKAGLEPDRPGCGIRTLPGRVRVRPEGPSSRACGRTVLRACGGHGRAGPPSVPLSTLEAWGWACVGCPAGVVGGLAWLLGMVRGARVVGVRLSGIPRV